MHIAISGMSIGYEWYPVFIGYFLCPLHKFGYLAAGNNNISDIQHPEMPDNRVKLLPGFQEVSLGSLTAGDEDINGTVLQAYFADVTGDTDESRLRYLPPQLS